jgi:hypothetical protein
MKADDRGGYFVTDEDQARAAISPGADSRVNRFAPVARDHRRPDRRRATGRDRGQSLLDPAVTEQVLARIRAIARGT